MLNICSKDINIDSVDTRYMTYMTDNPMVYIDIRYMSSLINKDLAQMKGLEKLISDYIFLKSGLNYFNLTPNSLIDFLIRFEEVPEELLLQPGKNGEILSLNETVRERIKDDRRCGFFMDLVNDYFVCKTALSRVKSCFNYTRKTQAKTRYGFDLGCVPFKYSKAVTGRIYSSDYNFQGLPKRYNGIICAPKDYFLIWADFSQIDLRVMTNMFYHDDMNISDLIDEYGDYYEVIARTAAKFTNQEFDSNLFKEQRPRYKEKILGTFYGSSLFTTSSGIDRSLANNLYSYIHGSKLYKDYEKQIQINIDSNIGFPIYSYFGTKILRHPGVKNIKTECLNAPIQSTSADIMKIYTLAIMDIFNNICKETLHKDPSQLIHIMLNRHDECIFIVHESLIPYMHAFNSFTKIRIDDWKPLEVHWSAGYNYGEEDSDLISKIENAKEFPITIYNSTEVCHKDYHPIPVAYIGTLAIKSINSKLVMYLGIPLLKKYFCFITDKKHSIKQVILQFLNEVRPHLSQCGLDRVILEVEHKENQLQVILDNIEFVCTTHTNTNLLNLYNLLTENLAYEKLPAGSTPKPQNTLVIPKEVIYFVR